MSVSYAACLAFARQLFFLFMGLDQRSGSPGIRPYFFSPLRRDCRRPEKARHDLRWNHHHLRLPSSRRRHQLPLPYLLQGRGSASVPHTAPVGRVGTREKASWPGFYRRGTTGATARRSGVAPCRVADSDRHSATGLMARLKRPA